MIVVCLGRVFSAASDTERCLIKAAIEAKLIPADWENNRARIAYHPATRLQCSASFFIAWFHVENARATVTVNLPVHNQQVRSNDLCVFLAVQLNTGASPDFEPEIKSIAIEFLVPKELFEDWDIRRFGADFKQYWFHDNQTTFQVSEELANVDQPYWRFEFESQDHGHFNDAALSEVMGSAVFYWLSKVENRWHLPPVKFPLFPAVITKIEFTPCFVQAHIARPGQAYYSALTFADQERVSIAYKVEVLQPQICQWYHSAEYLDFRGAIRSEIDAELLGQPRNG
jgi:hypothetical protein